MSFIDAYQDNKKEKIYVVERDKEGKRVFKEYPIDYSFYYTDPKGSFTSIYKEPCSKFSTQSGKTFRKELSKFRTSGRTFESDIKPIFKILENYYKGSEAPPLNIVFFDIEVDFHLEKGFAYPEDPFNKITSVSFYCSWVDKLITLAIRPPTLTYERAKEICDQFEDTYLCDSEEDLLLTFLDLIQDADILSGWNSEGFDIPYVIGRTERILGKEYSKKLCHWNVAPKARKFERFGKEQITYDIIGRVHLDYLQLYRKYTYHEQHSYSLDNIGKVELGESKVAYEGSLDDLYKLDFKKFIEYNRQDTMLLVKFENKLKFISLVNSIAHQNCVPLATTLGSVALVDQAITLESHERGFVIPDRKRENDIQEENNWFDEDDEDNIRKKTMTDEEIVQAIESRIAGAYVADPKRGLSLWIGSVDIKSLYPSTIMALNISPETIVGQLDQTETKQMLYNKMKKGLEFADAWSGIFNSIEAEKVFNRSNDQVTINLDKRGLPDKTIKVKGKEAYQFIYQDGNPFCMSANGTIFRYDEDGIIPGLLIKWFDGRIEMQVKAGAIEKELLTNNNLTKEEKEKLELDLQFWDQRQHSTKILMNSLYGAITNPGSKFFDQRMGQSITLVGRNVARHMAAVINEILTGVNDFQGECITYGDTDSAYFSAWPIREKLEGQGFEFNEDNVVELYDSVATAANKTFKQFMIDRFNCDSEKAKRIKANREICARSALFVKKKRYAALIFDKEGNRIPNGKLKIMGMDTQRADSPVYVQDFLKEVLKEVLSGKSENDIIKFIKTFRNEFNAKKPWEMGTPKRCNKLTYYTQLEEKIPNSRLPGHIRAAYNWNRLKKAFGDSKSMNILDGGKTIVCKLRKNPLKITSIAYPIDESNLPDWFKELPFDTEAMEYTLIDKKLQNIIGVLKWDLVKSKRSEVVNELFSF